MALNEGHKEMVEGVIKQVINSSPEAIKGFDDVMCAMEDVFDEHGLTDQAKAYALATVALLTIMEQGDANAIFSLACETLEALTEEV